MTHSVSRNLTEMSTRIKWSASQAHRHCLTAYRTPYLVSFLPAKAPALVCTVLSSTCRRLLGKVHFQARSTKLFVLMRAFSVLFRLPFPSLRPVRCVYLAAVAHVHGGLQRSECASSWESQLLKDKPGLQQRDNRGLRQSDIHDSSTCDTNTLSECYD